MRGNPEENKLNFFERYRTMFKDTAKFEKFRTCILTGKNDTTIRINNLFLKEEKILKLLEEEGFVLERFGGIPLAHSVKSCPGTSIGAHWTHMAGLYYVQSDSSMLPVMELDPQPGEKILDIAAAPGSKTTQIAQTMHNSGLIVANEVDIRRSASLSANCERLGLKNYVLINYRGESLGNLLPNYFDKVLVDAPCSADGASQKDDRFWANYSETGYEKLPRIQLPLLLSAFKAVKPGGTIVYSTCTLAPEENELLVQEFMDKIGTGVELDEISNISDFKSPLEITDWKGKEIRPDVARQVLRIIPGDTDMEAFFVAKFKKSPDYQETESIQHYKKTSEPVKNFISHTSKINGTVNKYLEDRGLLSSVTNCDIYEFHRSNDTDFYISPNLDDIINKIKITRPGLHFLNEKNNMVKLTTLGARFFGYHQISERLRYDIMSVEDLLQYAKGGDLKVTTDISGKFKQIIVFYKGVPLGLGLCMSEISEIKNQLKRNLCLR